MQGDTKLWQGSELHGVAKAWNSNAEYSHGEVAQGRSGDGMAMSCKALIGEGTARKSGAKQRHGKELFRRGKAERNAVCWGMA